MASSEVFGGIPGSPCAQHLPIICQSPTTFTSSSIKKAICYFFLKSQNKTAFEKASVPLLFQMCLGLCFALCLTPRINQEIKSARSRHGEWRLSLTKGSGPGHQGSRSATEHLAHRTTDSAHLQVSIIPTSTF